MSQRTSLNLAEKTISNQSACVDKSFVQSVKNLHHESGNPTASGGTHVEVNKNRLEIHYPWFCQQDYQKSEPSNFPTIHKNATLQIKKKKNKTNNKTR
jgi:hypothetical protein